MTKKPTVVMVALVVNVQKPIPIKAKMNPTNSSSGKKPLGFSRFKLISPLLSV